MKLKQFFDISTGFRFSKTSVGVFRPFLQLSLSKLCLLQAIPILFLYTLHNLTPCTAVHMRADGRRNVHRVHRVYTVHCAALYFVAISVSLSLCCLRHNQCSDSGCNINIVNMRLTLLKVPYLLLTFLPLVIAYNGHGIFGAIFWTILWLVFRQGVTTYTIISKSNKTKA